MINRWVWRVPLVAALAAGSHLYDWAWLRLLTVDTLVRISALLSVPMARLTPDTVFVSGVAAKFVVSCTLVDAFAGAVALLWRFDIAWRRNLLRICACFAGVFVLNIVRLEAGFVAMAHGAPWWLAHECVSGVTYFAILMYIVHVRAWAKPDQRSSLLSSSQPVSLSF